MCSQAKVLRKRTKNILSSTFLHTKAKDANDLKMPMIMIQPIKIKKIFILKSLTKPLFILNAGLFQSRYESIDYYL